MPWDPLRLPLTLTLPIRCRPKLFFAFRVLQLRVCQFERLRVEVITSKVYFFNILQDNVRGLCILQAKAVCIALLELGLLWLEVHGFGLLELRASRNLILKSKLLRRVT